MTNEPQYPPKNGRIDKYSKEFTKIFERIKNPPNSSAKSDFEAFLFRVFQDCKFYLIKELGVTFPNFFLTFIYNKEKYVELSKKLDLIYGKRPYSRAMVVWSRNQAPHIYIGVQDHLVGKPINIIGTICSSFIEELVHMIDLRKSETQIHNLVCSMLEGFLEINLPKNTKRERLRIAREYNDTVKKSRK